jgi:hypothetical protein
MLRRLLALGLQGEWGGLASVTAEFVRTHLWHPGIWLGVTACLVAPALAPSRLARGARFFAAVYVLFVVVHLLFLKVFVLSYRAIYQATFYMALAFLAETTLARLGEALRKPRWTTALRVAAIVVLVVSSAWVMSRFRERLRGRHVPYPALQAALVDALLESGAQPGDRAFVPTPFAFHLRRKFDVVSYPPNWRYFQGYWGPAFREGIRVTWGEDALARVDPQYLCWAMGLAYIQPRWVLSWNGDYGVMQPFRKFFRRFPDLPGMGLTEVHRTDLPPPYGGNVQVFRLELSDAMSALDRTLGKAEPHCP